MEKKKKGRKGLIALAVVLVLILLLGHGRAHGRVQR